MTGTDYWNAVLVSVLWPIVCNQPELPTEISGSSFQTMRILGKTTHSCYRIGVPGWVLISKACLDRVVTALPEINAIVAIAHLFQVRSQKTRSAGLAGIPDRH